MNDTVSAPVLSPQDHRSPRQRRGIALTIGLMVLFMTVVLALFFNKITTPRVLSVQELRANGTYVFEQPRIVRDFSLLDQSGQAFGLEQLQGKWTLMFFGFTACPDVCPTTLSLLREVKAKLQPEIAEQTRFVLVSVDPARDTVAQMATYMPHFDEEFIGLTGEFLQIKRLANQLNMAFVKVPQGDDYTVDHSANLAIINPYGHYHGFIKPPLEQARVRLTLQSIITDFDD